MKEIRFGTVNIASVIQSMLPVLNCAEKTLANYLLDNMEQVIHMTIEQLASNSQTSYSTVSRFCQKLGFKGYKDFRNKLTTDVISNASKFSETQNTLVIHDNESEENICEKTFLLFDGILQDCASLLNFETLKAAVDLIVGARVLHVIGSGASAASAMYAHTQLLRLGRPCTMESDPTVYQMTAALMGPEDVLLAISSSGRTTSIIAAARTASERGAHVISISDFLVSPLQRISAVNLYTTSRNSVKYTNVDMPLTIGQIALIDILYSCCMARLGEKGRANYLATKEATDMGKSK